MTPEQQDQINQCRDLLRTGYNAQDMRNLGYAQAAIDAAIIAEDDSMCLGYHYND